MKYPFRTLSSLLSSALGLFASTTACDSVEREVSDKFDSYQASAWTSARDCAAQPRKDRAVPRAPRIGNWNVMYFPDADVEPETDEDEGSDVAWLACAIASLDVDILAVQEFKRTARALEKQAELIALLNAQTSGNWRVQLAECQPDDVQHPGFLYDASRVTGGQFRQIDTIHPAPVCNNRASPAFAGYFSIQNGPDFHLIVLHLEAYPEERSLAARMYSNGKLGELAEQAYAVVPDHDVIYTGDFNTTGCEDCDPALSSRDEIALLRATLAQPQRPLTLIDADLTCSKPGGSLLDHFVTTPSMAEVPAGTRAQVLGSCAEAGCDRLRDWHQASTERLSDHCPLVLSLAPLDDD